MQLRRQESEIKRARNTIFAYEVAFRQGTGGIANTSSTASPALSLLRHKLVQLQRQQQHGIQDSSVHGVDTHSCSMNTTPAVLGPSQSLLKLATQDWPVSGGTRFAFHKCATCMTPGFPLPRPPAQYMVRASATQLGLGGVSTRPNSLTYTVSSGLLRMCASFPAHGRAAQIHFRVCHVDKSAHTC